MYLKKLKIGNVELKNNIILAPMAGITDLPFRSICKKFGTGLTYTEMVSSKALYYNDEKITELINVIEDNARKRKTSDCELFFEKLGYITGLVNVRDDLKRYDDMDYYYSYLIRKFNLNKGKNQYVKPGIFFKNDDKTMKDIINITLVEYKKFPPRFYVMKKVDENYKIRELEKDETIELLKEYNCPIVQYYFEERAAKMIDNRISRIIK